MDWAGTITAAATIVTALGGLELIKFLLNRGYEDRKRLYVAALTMLGA